MRLEKVVLSTIRHYRMLRAGDRGLVAVSGGPDSVALLAVLSRLTQSLGITLAVGHFNHRWRGAESDEDERFVTGLARQYGFELVTERADTVGSREPDREAAARRQRYEFLRRAAAQLRANRIATGHTRNDQAETVLMKLMRGAGERGLAGIFPVVDDLIIRPLLECDRSDVLAFLAANSSAYRNDSSNLSSDFLRNRIRSELLPLLERQYNPRIVEALARTAEIQRLDGDVLTMTAERWVTSKEPLVSGRRISIAELLEQPEGLRRHIWAALFSKVGGGQLSWIHRKGLERLLSPGQSARRQLLPGGWSVRREFDHLIVESGEEKKAEPFQYEWTIPGEIEIAETGTRLSARPFERDHHPDGTGEFAIVAAERLEPTLKVRSWQAGDRYQLEGDREPKKLKELFQNHRISLSDRRTIPLVISGDAIVWVPGLPAAIPFRATEQDEKRFILEWIY